jgi:hypothetical protein
MAEEKWVGEITKEEAKSRVVRRMTDEEKEILKKINWNLWEIDDGLGYFLMMALMFSLIMGTMLLMHGYSENNFHEKAAGIAFITAFLFAIIQMTGGERKNRIEKHAFRLTQPKEGTK